MAADLDGITINEVRNLPELFNDLKNETSTVNIFGPTLVFGADDTVPLHRQFSGRVDLRDLCLSADVVVIRSPLLLPQTHVTIYARELRFERDGRIETIPMPRRHRPPPVVWTDDLAAGRNGDPGHKAGDVDVFVQRVLSDATTSRRLVLRGGEGGPAGEGRDGLDDGQFPFLSQDWNRLMERSGNTICGVSDLGSTVIFRETTLNNRVTSRCGSRVAAFGESAVRSGVPGPGGNGGTLRATASIGQYADVTGGAPGVRAANHAGATLSGSSFVHEFVRTIVVGEREITTTREEDAPRERGRDATAPVGTAGNSGTFLFLTNADPRLSLSLNLAREAVTLSWPSFLAGFRVQQSTNLASTNWVDVQQPFSESDGTRFLSIRFAIGPHFYRLAKQPLVSAPVTTATFTNGVPR